MNQHEMARVMAWVASNYPNMQQKDLNPTVHLWMRMFSDVPPERFEGAVMKAMARSEFFPTVAAISKALMTESDLTPIEAWGEVTKAIRVYGYVREGEALKSMSPMTQNVVRALGWKEICSSEEPEVLRGQFMNHYGTLVNRAKDIAVLPKGQRGMGKLSDSMKDMVDMLSGDERLKLEGE